MNNSVTNKGRGDAPITPDDTLVKRGEFRCEDCGGVYENGWSDEEASAESQAAFGITTGAVVCDDCYNKIMYHRALPATQLNPEAPTVVIGAPAPSRE